MRHKPYRLLIAGHVNAGKTTLIRTLSGRSGWGQVHDLPSTFSVGEEIALQAEDKSGVVLIDGPGMQDPCAAWSLMEALDADEPGSGVHRLLLHRQAPERHSAEVAALRAAQRADLVVWLIDARRHPAPKHRAGWALVRATERPVVVVFTRVREVPAVWRAALTAWGQVEWIRLDAERPGTDGVAGWFEGLAGCVEGASDLRLHAAAIRSQERVALSNMVGRMLENITRWAARRLTLDHLQLSGHAGIGPLGLHFKQTLWDELEAALEVWSRQLGHDLTVGWPINAGRSGATPDPLNLIDLPLDDTARGLALGTGSQLSTDHGAEQHLGTTWGWRGMQHWFSKRQDLYVADTVLHRILGWALGLAQQLQACGHGATGRLSLTPLQVHGRPALLDSFNELLKEARRQSKGESGHLPTEGRALRRRQALMDAVRRHALPLVSRDAGVRL